MVRNQPGKFHLKLYLRTILLSGHLGGSVGWASDFGSGHDLAVREFEPHVGLSADSSEPGPCFRFCVPLSLRPTPDCAPSLCLSKMNEHQKKKNKNRTILLSSKSLNLICLLWLHEEGLKKNLDTDLIVKNMSALIGLKGSLYQNTYL